jgi:hypothetical protein
MKKSILVLILTAFIAGPTATAAPDARAKSNRVLPVRAYASKVPAQQNVQRTYFTATSISGRDLLEFRRELMTRGAAHVNFFYPDVIVCELPPDLDVSTIPGYRGVTRMEETSVGPFRAPGLSSRESWVKMCYERAGEGARKPLHTAGAADDGFNDVVNILSPQQWREASEILKSAGIESQGGREINQYAEFWGADILVQMVLPESNGEYDTELERWTDDQISDAVSGAAAAMLDMQGQFPAMPMHYVFRDYPRAECGYEAIKYPMNNDGDWIMDVIGRLDPSLPAEMPLARVHAFNMKVRAEMETDFVFTGFIVNSENAPGHVFHGADYTAYATLGGPYNITPYPAGRDPNLLGDWLVFSKIFQHETGHIFWALDEYLSSPGFCNARSGYLNYDNLNKLPQRPDGEIVDCTLDGPHDCIMQNAAREDVGRPWCRWTKGQTGVIDRNNNSYPDVFEAAPRVEFTTAAVETLSTPDITIDVRIISTAVSNKNPMQSAQYRRDYAAPVGGAKYNILGLGDNALIPADGNWDEVEEEASLRLENLPAGLVTVNFKAKNSIGYWSGDFQKKIYYIGVSFAHLNLVVRPENISFSWDVVDDRFGAVFDVYRLLPDETGVGERIVANVQPSGPDLGGFVPYAVTDSDVVPGLSYRYYVEAYISVEVGGETKEFWPRSNVVGATSMIPMIGSSIISGAAPNPFRGKTKVSVTVPPTFVDRQINNSPGSTGNGFKQRVPTEYELAVYDVAGRRIKLLDNGKTFDDVITREWDGTNFRNVPVPTGIYFVRAKAGDAMGVRKVLLLR